MRCSPRTTTSGPTPPSPPSACSFGTSGHRGSATARTFNEAHVLAISEAVCRHREAEGIDGPLFLGRDTHALSEPATRTIVEVLGAHGVDVVLDADDGADADAGDLARDPHPQPRRRPRHAPTGSSSPRRTTRPATAASSTTRRTAARPTPTSRAGSRTRPTRCSRRGSTASSAWPTRTPRCARRDYVTAYVDDLARGDRPRGDPRRGPQARRRPARRREPALLGGDRRAPRPRPRDRQRRARPDLPLRAARLGRQDPHGLLLALRDGAPDRPQGPLRRRLRQRPRRRPPRHRHAVRGAAEPQPPPRRLRRLPVRRRPRVGGGRRRRQDAS